MIIVYGHKLQFVEFFINVKVRLKLLLKGAVERSETEDCRKKYNHIKILQSSVTA